jgi:hypothetical protein
MRKKIQPDPEQGLKLLGTDLAQFLWRRQIY